MKLFISSDMEGVAGAAEWNETENRDGAWYPYLCRQMTREVAAVCEGALAAGVTDILVKDAHGTGRNINPAGLPRSVCINRGWSGNPFDMVAGLSADFDALAFTGYHAHAGADGNPLSHTMDTNVHLLTINGQAASEFVIYSYVAGMMGVPVVFVSGDAALCAAAKTLVPGITAVAVSRGGGNASTSIHPDDAAAMMRDGIRAALKGDFSACRVKMPRAFDVRVTYREPHRAFSMAFYPGARQLDERTIAFEHTDYNEVLRFFHFVLPF